ncbi:MAG: PD40 domain-containing protein [Bdellovibrionales bacterium]|nr:PD40 domain-containing protein [Bdellovibrionales bacterium]
MDKKRRTQKTCAFFFGFKSLATLLIVAGVVSCETPTSKVDPSSLVKKIDNSKERLTPFEASLELLTYDGESRQPTLAQDGKSIYFVGFNRQLHSEAQIYHFILDSKTEKRVTYNDGENLFPTLSYDQKELAYISTTDSIKENPNFDQLVGSKLQTKAITFSDHYTLNEDHFEVYTSDTNGRNIRRMTNRKGAEIFPQYIGKRDSDLVWFRTQTNQVEPRLPNSYLPSSRSLGSEKFRLLQFRMNPYADVKASVVELNGDTVLVAQFPDGKRTAQSQLTGFTSIHSFSIENINGEAIVLLSAKANEKSNYDIFAWSPKSNSQQTIQLTNHSADDWEPQMSSDGKNLIFSSFRTGSNQIYLIRWPNDMLQHSDLKAHLQDLAN